MAPFGKETPAVPLDTVAVVLTSGAVPVFLIVIVTLPFSLASRMWISETMP